MTRARKDLGAAGERMARAHLEGLGYTILETNHRTRHGELDMVALEGGCLVFVEVRTRRGEGFGTPEESVDPHKTQRLVRLGEEYAAGHPELPADLRVDVVAVQLTERGRLVRIAVIPNATAG